MNAKSTRLIVAHLVFVVFAILAVFGGASRAAPPCEAPKNAMDHMQACGNAEQGIRRHLVDTDGDGVPDQLERYGYTYNASTSRFERWNPKKQPHARHWFTDPLQWSTDQDAYSDGMEASQALMDVAVRGPGDHPLVPAYPNIVVQLMGYSITLNEEISYGQGGSLAKGSTWNRETVQTSSISTEVNWEASVEVGGGATGPEVNVSAKVGGAITGTQTVSFAKSVGGSVLDERSWSQARATNPSEAARIKLNLKVRNFGTACASNVVPTLTLRIGGINVATFEPGNAQVNLLVPGGVYPPEEGIYWVVDSIDTGAAVTPLTLTLDELRALERGAPVSISVTQLKADVMSFDSSRDKPGWSPIGDANEYLARCDAVAANILVEIGDGSFSHHLVFADDATSVPRVTLGDALDRIGMRDGAFHYRDSTGAMRKTQLANYKFVFDQKTLADNGWDITTSPATPPDRGDTTFSMADMMLGPETTLYVRAPRDASDRGPTIHYANADELTRRITVCTSDYQGIETVRFIPSQLQECREPQESQESQESQEARMMSEEVPGSGFYSLMLPDPDYIFDGSERVVVTNIAKETAEQAVSLVHYEEPPQPVKPVIRDVKRDLVLGRVSARVTTAFTQFPVQWVRLYHPDLKEGATAGYAEMRQSIEAYKDPDKYEIALPDGFDWTIDPMIVAYVAPNVYEERLVSQRHPGELSLSAAVNWPEGLEKLAIKTRYMSTRVDFDFPEPVPEYFKQRYEGASGEYDVAYWCNSRGSQVFTFNGEVRQVEDMDFEDIDSQIILERLKEPATQHMSGGKPTLGYEKGSIFVFKTNRGRLVKLQVTDVVPKSRAESYRSWEAMVRYEVFSQD